MVTSGVSNTLMYSHHDNPTQNFSFTFLDWNPMPRDGYVISPWKPLFCVLSLATLTVSVSQLAWLQRAFIVHPRHSKCPLPSFSKVAWSSIVCIEDIWFTHPYICGHLGASTSWLLWTRMSRCLPRSLLLIHLYRPREGEAWVIEQLCRVGVEGEGGART